MDRHIMDTLEAFGFEWDGVPAYQSRTTAEYQAALDILIAQGRIYYCRCSRKEVAAAAERAGDEGPIYPGTCSKLHLRDGPGRAARILAADESIVFVDDLFGVQSQNPARDVGDFVVRRADGFFAYQLAVVVDDQLQGIDHVVRGADLLSSTPRQIWLQRLLGYATPRYLHIPLVYGGDGRKLSKSDAAHPVDIGNPLASLLDAWKFLQPGMPESRDMSLSEFWQWAPSVWNPRNMQARTER
jgi:glutamyl-Q tRNA(Asp) synthetase